MDDLSSTTAPAGGVVITTATERALSPHPVRAWLALVLVLLVCLPPLLIDLGHRVSTHTMENVALVTSQETWLRWHEGEPGAWLVTSNDTLPRVEKPPMLTWLNFLAWSDLTPQTSTPVQLTYRARLVTVVLGLIMLASVFWMGYTLGDLRMAAVATLIAGSMFFLQRQARWASYDIHFVTWVTLAIAAALWAMKPTLGKEGASRWRGIVGWSLSGLAMAASVMSKNPLAFVLILLPVMSAMMLSPWSSRGLRPRIADLVGLCGAALLASALVVPWYLHVIYGLADASRTLKMEFRQPRSDPQPFYYYIGVVALVLPWTAWMFGGLVQPFTVENRSRRRQLLVAWMWFVILLVFFSIPPAKQQRYILPIVPAVALLAAQLIRQHQEIADRGLRDRFGESLNGIMWIALLVVSFAMGPFMATQDWFMARHWPWFPRPVVIPIAWPFAIAFSATLVAVALIGWSAQRRWKPTQSAVLVAIWTIIATAVFWHAYAEVPTKVSVFKAEAERIAAVVGTSPLRSLRITEVDHLKYKLNEEFRFYYGRLIRRITPDALEAYASGSNVPVYVLAKSQRSYEEAMRNAGYLQVDANVKTDDKDIQELWMHEGRRE
jgi:hypothetical protein